MILVVSYIHNKYTHIISYKYYHMEWLKPCLTQFEAILVRILDDVIWLCVEIIS